MAKKINMTGWVMKEHGVPRSRLTVESEDLTYYIDHPLIKNKRPRWICRCECGNRVSISGEDLRSGKVISCGCAKTQTKSRIVNLINKRFGMLVVESFSHLNKHKESIWKCRCDCGGICYKANNELRNGDTKSCGCLKASYNELKIRKILKEHNIPFITEYTYEDLIGDTGLPLRYDFYINNQFLLEYDGEQHFKPTYGQKQFEKRQCYDKIKNEYALIHNIPLKRIPYWDSDKITLENIISDKWLINN